MSDEPNGYFSEISPLFRPYLQNIYQHLNLGLCKTKIDLEKTCCISSKDENQFRLVLPYCTKKLKWDIIFEPTAPWFAPDFKFDDESFLCGVDEDFLDENIPSLSKWDAKNPKALSLVLSEFITLYKKYQVSKLNEDEHSRAYFEYSALLGDALTSEKDIEVWVGDHNVEFLIKLNLVTCKLPEIYHEGIEKNPGGDSALLLVRYPNCTNAELILSPFLSNILGHVALPAMYQSGVLMDYVPMVTELLNKKIQTMLNNENMKNELLSQLIVKFEGAVIEHNTNGASFLFEIDDFYWILQIDLGINFPEKPPVATLRSVYHLCKGKPKFKVLPSCPFNNFIGFIINQVEIFKNDCVPTSDNQNINVDS